MRFYRFELAFDGEPQDVGFLQGIDDIGLGTKTEACLLDQFAELACPDLASILMGEQVSFWFNQEGMETFLPAIRNVQTHILDRGWEILFAVMDVTAEELKERAVYADKHQAAFHTEWVKDGLPEYRPLPPMDDDWAALLGKAMAS